MYYINNFFIYSIFGFIFETFVCFILGNNFESGILYSPITPVYGIGIIIIILIYNNLKIKVEYLKGIMIFILSFIILTIIEYIGGILIEFIFKDTLWNYSNLPMHIGKYISIGVSLLWSFGSLIYIYLFKPITDKLVLIIPKYVTYILLVILIIDFTITLIIKQKIF